MLGELSRVGLTANLRKCHLGFTEAQYLDYHIGQSLLKPQESKIEAVKSYPCPTTKCQLHSFLGLVGYRRFVCDFSSVASTLSDLTRIGKPEKVCWTREAKGDFQNLKTTLTSSPVLRNPDFSLLGYMDTLETDLGAFLSQNFDGKEHPIIFASHKLTPAE